MAKLDPTPRQHDPEPWYESLQGVKAMLKKNQEVTDLKKQLMEVRPARPTSWERLLRADEDVL
jgi:uncharacterized protein YhaN